jgi:hypothetical protein
MKEEQMNERLTQAVDALAGSSRLRAKLRRDPERALRRFRLTPEETRAVIGGDLLQLLELGLDPAYGDGCDADLRRPLRAWAVRNAGRLSPLAFAAAVLIAMPASASARKRSSPGRRALCRVRARCGGRDFGVRPPAGGLAVSNKELREACKGGFFEVLGFSNQGQCVSTVNQEFPDGVVLFPAPDGTLDVIPTDQISLGF